MPTFTSRLSLRKPSTADTVNVQLDLNDNYDIIDAAIADILDNMLAPGIWYMYGGSSAPAGWFLLDGQAISRTTYPKLFACYGTTYGAGNGTTTFNLPNVKGRVPVGVNSADSEFNALGETGGAKTHTLTIGEMPNHNHPWRGVNDGAAVSGSPGSYPFRIYQDVLDNWQGSQSYMQGTGGNGAHNNLQPYITCNFIVKAE